MWSIFYALSRLGIISGCWTLSWREIKHWSSQSQETHLSKIPLRYWKPANIQERLTTAAEGTVHLPAAASQGCTHPKELPRATAAHRGSAASKRIQSESSTLGANGQYLLHRVKSHGRRLIGEAMTDSLVRYVEKWRRRKKGKKKKMC